MREPQLTISQWLAMSILALGPACTEDPQAETDKSWLVNGNMAKLRGKRCYVSFGESLDVAADMILVRTFVDNASFGGLDCSMRPDPLEPGPRCRSRVLSLQWLWIGR